MDMLQRNTFQRNSPPREAVPREEALTFRQPTMIAREFARTRRARDPSAPKLSFLKQMAENHPDHKPRLSLIVYRMRPMIYHTAICVDKRAEFHFFDGGGVVEMMRLDPLVASMLTVPVYEEIDLGMSKLPYFEIYKFMREMDEISFAHDQYDLLLWNCNHFTEYVAQRYG
ncbi:putative PPPDE peptidase domain protein [Gregarina niphandrodes]|uniref:PPPDE peptidase domain protein n=1 Tax=Gregarina niphandrodes TaxID=110365 RepID=A0A023B7Q0_GRENI|nr:putative PPPDE peptidase domain protein [Gregarina niphandrodes]EZG67541.1 putative PPPDE peptidase domain protein [Gregarina niphandrodes]|eukprot:XP_011130202.1 putative PPPDE peptidase domain protein [Gregarina niphandrodes]